MAKKRNIGAEILAGLREIKRGEHGRVITVPSVTAIRETTGLSQAQLACLLGVYGSRLRHFAWHWPRPFATMHAGGSDDRTYRRPDASA